MNTSNSVPNPNVTGSPLRCKRCGDTKNKREFLKPRKGRGGRVPLRDLPNNGEEEGLYLRECQPCRDAQNAKRKSNTLRKEKTSKANDAKLDSYTHCSWEEVRHMIEEGFVFAVESR
jgi:hypothetical protein